jgi:hypothetical protein
LSAVARALLPALAASSIAFLSLPATAQPTPTPTPSRQSQPSSTPQPGLPISVHLGGIRLELDIPLNLRGLLGGPTTTMPPPSTPPPSSSPATRPAHRPTPPPTHARTSPTPQQSPAGPGAQGGNPAPPGAPSAGRSHRRTHPQQKPHKTSSSGPKAITSLVHNPLLSDSGAGLLVGLVGACAVGVAGVVLMGGRRGRHRA